MRRTERQLIQEYREYHRSRTRRIYLSQLNRPGHREIARLPDLIRGYEQIKLDNVARFREEVRRLRAVIG